MAKIYLKKVPVDSHLCRGCYFIGSDRCLKFELLSFDMFKKSGSCYGIVYKEVKK
jgi:hypothetical protein